MRLTELFEDDTPSAQEWLEAWTAVEQDLRDAHDGQTVAKIKNHAHRKYFQVGRKIDATGAIERAEGAVTNKNTLAQKKADRMAQRNKASQTKQAPEKPARDKVKRTITKGDPDRVGKSGKKWGNQYYSDPAQAGGVKGAIARNRPGTLAKRAVDKVDQEIGKALDVTNLAGNVKSLNPRNRRK